MALRDLFTLDAWSNLNHKAPLRDDIKSKLEGFTPRSWIPETSRRRLMSYMVLAAYESNTSRAFLDGDDDDRRNQREYGDAALVVDSVLSHLLGDTQEIVVPGAEDYDPDFETKRAELDTRNREAEAAHNAEQTANIPVTPPPAPVVPDGPDGTPPVTSAPVPALVDAGSTTVIDPAPVPFVPEEGPTPEEITAQAEARSLFERQDFLREWADKIDLGLRLQDHERNTVQYGDGVWLLGWDGNRNRVTAAVMDPGFYFPVLPDSIDQYDYPTRVHFAWEIPEEMNPDGKRRLRRITYSLEPIHYEPVFDDGGDLTGVVAPEGTTIDGDGLLYRAYAWDDEPSPDSCYVTDATWVLDDLKDADDFDRLLLDKAEKFEVDNDGVPIRDTDLLIDFLPVVHIPNTPPAGQHFGRSSLGSVLQILDDLQNADTDAQSASATTGSPIIGVAGTKIADGDPTVAGRTRSLTIGAGSVWDLGAEGRLDHVDTSGNLGELRNYVLGLRDRLSINSRLPGAVLGTIKPSEVPSGFAMQLSFGPLSALVRQLRLTRSVKYPLLLKMVQRLYQANGLLDSGETPRAEMRFGSFLPSDMAGVLNLVTTGVTSHVLSLETGLKMLVDAGFPIEDAAEEIIRIQSRNFEAANALADVTGDENAVADYLGLDHVDPEAVAPAPVIRPTVPALPPIPTVGDQQATAPGIGS